MSGDLIYLDYAATTPVDDDVLSAMKPFFCDIFANPSSKHTCGRRAAKAIDDSREIIAKSMGAKLPSEIVFTSGASESNNLAIKGFAEKFDEPRHFITTSIEHKAALNAVKDLAEWGHRFSIVDPDKNGVINPSDIESEISDDTVFVSCMLVNNEVGTIQPIHDIGDLCRSRGVAFHCDGTQGFGKMELDVKECVDMLSISAHKFYGPKGVGALYVADEVSLKCQISGGSQEGGKRSGTLNVPGIVGMAKAAEIGVSRMRSEWERMEELGSLFMGLVRSKVPISYLQAESAPRVPWIYNICFPGADSGRIRDMLGEREICVSRTSACADSGGVSHVLEAMGTRKSMTSSAVRFSFGSRSNEQKVRDCVDALADVVSEIRSES